MRTKSTFPPIAILLLPFIFWSACRKEFDHAPSSGSLEFSRDTVYLDTLFSGIGSSTYTLKVYNRSNKDLQVPTITLGLGENSSYRLNVDGVAGKSFKNVPILAKDSMYILIENTYTISDTLSTEFLSTDVIHFIGEGNKQEVSLVSLIRDAIFLYPGMPGSQALGTVQGKLDGEGITLSADTFTVPEAHLTFTNTKPYVIYGYATVEKDQQLIMEAGTRTYFHNNSGLLIHNGGSLHINGGPSLDEDSMEGEVIFEGDRPEANFENEPGQWGGIWILGQSAPSYIEHLTLRNARIGILVKTGTVDDNTLLSLKNVQIYNSSITNLWSRSGDITAENVVLGNAGTHSFHGQGGNYNFVHCTIANYYNKGFRVGAALALSNFMTKELGDEKIADLKSAIFTNCIIWGSGSNEYALAKEASALFNFHFDHCLLKKSTASSGGDVSLYDLTNKEHYDQVLVNGDPVFLDPLRHNLAIGPTSAALGWAKMETAPMVPYDILGKDRTNVPDIGAYQHLD
ncbi:MAG: hypothetical protein V7724_05485 [Sediminicola sp.]|tara:strand:- start:73588 stop:75129 length:1542 start_codon:yes stop_codon:yes gene_type:complete